jgi:hypothetical protein
MGTEPAWVPLVLSLAGTAIGTGATIYNQRQTAKKQDDQLAAQLRSEAAKQKQADAQTQALIQNVKNSTATDEKAGALGQFTQAIQANRANAERPLQSQGAVSDAYKKAGSDAALGMATKASGLADLVSSIDAPFQQRQDDKTLLDNYDQGIGLLRRENQGDDFLAELKRRRIRPNPWISAAGDLASGAARGYGGVYGAASSDTMAGGGTSLYSDGSGYTYNLPSY